MSGSNGTPAAAKVVLTILSSLPDARLSDFRRSKSPELYLCVGAVAGALPGRLAHISQMSATAASAPAV
jgi:hypothetical protein